MLFVSQGWERWEELGVQNQQPLTVQVLNRTANNISLTGKAKHDRRWVTTETDPTRQDHNGAQQTVSKRGAGEGRRRGDSGVHTLYGQP